MERDKAGCLRRRGRVFESPRAYHYCLRLSDLHPPANRAPAFAIPEDHHLMNCTKISLFTDQLTYAYDLRPFECAVLGKMSTQQPRNAIANQNGDASEHTSRIWRRSINPRETISGGASSPPVCPLIARMGRKNGVRPPGSWSVPFQTTPALSPSVHP